MKTPEEIPHCCSGKTFSKIGYGYEGYTLKRFQYEHPCTAFDTIFLSVDFRIYHFKLPECWAELSGKTLLEIKKYILLKKFGREVYATRDFPKWKGENTIYETPFLSENNLWVYYIETPIESGANIFLDEWEKGDGDTVSNYYEGRLIKQTNQEWLSSQNFISKRASIYEITPTDVNILLTQFKNQYNGKLNIN